jgi:hypothetical protein
MYLRVTGSGVHDFVRSRLQREKNQATKTAEPTRPPLKASDGGYVAQESSSDEAQRKIAERKARKSTTEPYANKFEYNADEPLRLEKPNK